MVGFQKFSKMARLSRDMIITEKLDGTNVQILIEHRSLIEVDKPIMPFMYADEMIIVAGSRNRYLSIGNDNYGFAKWVSDNREELIKLGPGRHFGEWWGQGIQRKYGLTEKRFSLFNVKRWKEDRPACCHIVPVLYEGLFDTIMIDNTIEDLKYGGSIAAFGFRNPEGIVVYHTAGNFCMKKTIENDEIPKSLQQPKL